ncbi:MBL fold metallo-hydrolase [Inhella sp.]|uniref:MBL fold metallo-hydrolase n=1 Tax=Inhella sp. TaxID=1921806 RepID=UPI0035B45C6B
MSLRVLGCSGAIAAGCHTTAFLLDGRTLIDAGTGVGNLSLEELSAINDVLLSHSHLDHVLGIPLLADSVMRQRRLAGRGPIRVHGLPDTLQALRDHLFNGVIWPDFTRLPTPEAPALQLLPLAIGQVLEVGGRRIEVLPARHTVPACGYAVQHRRAPLWWAYTGDTGPNPLLWRRLARLPLSHLVIEAAFSDEESELAALAQHHCPRTLLAELSQFEQPGCSIWLTHIKPGELRAVMAGLAQAQASQPLQPLLTGQCFQLD